jgi:uncharacterized protein YciW
MTRAGVEALQDAGLSERDILDLNQVVGYFAHVNRLADVLGLPLMNFWNERAGSR